MMRRHGLRRMIARALVFSLPGWLAAPAVHADGLPTEPVLRIEAGMHGAAITRVATDQAGRWLVTASNDKTVRVWEISSGRLVRRLRPPIGDGKEGMLYAVAMAPNGATIASAGWTKAGQDSNSIYLFERASGSLVKRIPGLPNVIQHLAWSSDGRYLAATLGGNNGVRVYRTPDFSLIGEDKDYGSDSYGADFDRRGRLVTSSWDGSLRLYQVTEQGLKLLAKKTAPGGKQPFAVQFNPGGDAVAVGFYKSTRVNVLSPETLELLYAPDTSGVDNGDLASVAWSANGRFLYAGGQFEQTSILIRRWEQAGRGRYVDLQASANTIMDIRALPGGIVFGAQDPAWGVFDATGRRVAFVSSANSNFRNLLADFRVSDDGTVVQFRYKPGGSLVRFYVKQDSTSLRAPVTEADGLRIEDWGDSFSPQLNGRPLPLERDEFSRSLAIAPDGKAFVLGTEWSLRLFDRTGKELWPEKIPLPGIAWTVNISGDGRLVVAALGDGTIRWYRRRDGRELLAFFPHSDEKRWVVWTPLGYYDVAPGSENLIGWHLNRGPDQAADFFPVSRFRDTFLRPDVVERVLETADEAEALRLADRGAGRKTEQTPVTGLLPPVVELLFPADGGGVSRRQVTVRFAVRTPPDAPVTGVRVKVNGQFVSLPQAGPFGAAGAWELAVPIPPEDSEIMVLARNRHAVSSPAVLRLKWTGPPQPKGPVKPTLYMLAVGVGKDYKDKSLTRLEYAAKDARDFVKAMENQKGALYHDVKVRLLLEGDAHRDAVLEGLEWLRKEVTEKDVGMVFLSGHGKLGDDRRYYFLPVKADLNKLISTGVVFSEIRDTVIALASKARVALFLDACRSGSSKDLRTIMTRTVNELVDPEKGVAVFASSKGDEDSLEHPAWRNGAFTKVLLECSARCAADETGAITVETLRRYVEDEVKRLTSERQHAVASLPPGFNFPIAVGRRR